MRDFYKGILIPIIVILMFVGIAASNDVVAQVVTETNFMMMP